MIVLQLQDRIIENKDWATLLFFLCFILIAFIKTFFAPQFYDFLRLPFSKKYLTTYKDNSNLYSVFTVSLFFIQVVAFSFLIQYFLFYGKHISTSKSDWITYIQIFTALTIFILIKFYLEKIIANVFNIEYFLEIFNLKKVIYRTYIGLFFFPIVVFIYYNNFFSINIISAFLVLITIAMIYFYFLSILNYQKLILSKIFYFILYLCTLELGPYYFMYYWLTKK